MRPITSLAIPQPCHESWAAMSPTAPGRHCAACAQTVVDFTLKTDAEILVYLAGAVTGRTCGRFAAGQLERPLQRVVPAAPSGRWRAWLAAMVAIWALRESIGTEAKAQTATEWRSRYWVGPVPAAPVGEVVPLVEAATAAGLKPCNITVLPSTVPATVITMGMVSSQLRTPVVVPLVAAPMILRGVVTDSTSGEGLSGATVLLPGTQTGVSTGPTGEFTLSVPAEWVLTSGVKVQVSSIGYVTQQRVVTAATAAASQVIRLQADVKGMMGVVVMPPRRLPPAPWHLRACYYWGKYWLIRPFRRG